MTEPGKTSITIHVNGQEYVVQDNAAGRRAVEEIDEAHKTGGRVTFHHEGGETTVDIAPKGD
jgi:hypothetical protein